MVSPEQENKRLERTLQELLRRIEDNQQIQNHFQQFESQIFQCDNLPELLDALLFTSLEHFRLDSVTLLLNDSHHQMRTLSEQLQIPSYDGRLHFFHNQLIFNNLFAQPPVARLGVLEPLEAIKIFPQGTRIRSSALLPLIRHQQVLGSFNFGSVDESRFTADKSPDFLHHLAMVVAVCLENCFSVESLRHQSLVDVLTQVYNRRSFELEMEKELSRAQRHGHPLACLFLDIDHFKQINDTFGHASGDECLRQVARTIRDLLRKTDVFARYGGEEFIALLPEETLSQAQQTAERIRQRVAALTVQAENGKTFQPTVSIGVASDLFDADKKNLRACGEQLISRADHVMYNAKRSGRNRVCLAE